MIKHYMLALFVLLTSGACAQDKTYEQLKREYTIKDSVKKAAAADSIITYRWHNAVRWFSDSTITREEVSKFGHGFSSTIVSLSLALKGSDRNELVGYVFFRQHDFKNVAELWANRAIGSSANLPQPEIEMLATGNFNHQYFNTQPDLPDPDPNQFVSVTKYPEPLNMDEVKNSVRYPLHTPSGSKVMTKILIDTSGTPTKHIVLRSPSDSVSRAVEAVIYKLRCNPAQIDGKPVRFWLAVPFCFTPAPDSTVTK